MNRLYRCIVLVMIASASWHAGAESFMGIDARSRMASLQTLFPNAEFQDSKAAWLKPYQRLVEIAGPGISGTLAVKLEHEVEATRALAKDLALRQLRQTLEPWQAAVMSDLPARLQKLEQFPPADPWEVKDIRWAPPTPISIQNAKAKYGVPDSDSTDEQFRRILKWSARGVTAFVDKDESVSLLIFEFTLRDYVCSGLNAPPACKAATAEAKPEAGPRRGAKK